ncbi:MAG: hypothetical protein Tsb0010_16800 [Parvularculaceae bacterium]
MNAFASLGVDVRETPQIERRLAQRVFLYWLLRCKDRPYAKPEDIEPEAIGRDWDWCFVIDAARSCGFPYFTHLGQKLAGFSGVLLSGRDWTQTLLDKATQKFQQTLEERAPVLIEEEVTLYNRQRLLCRSILLPLSEDGRNITHVLGAANGKICNELVPGDCDKSDL